MIKDVQRMLKSRDQSERKHTQHNMIEQAKSSVCVCLAKKAKSSRLDAVHTRPDGPSGRFTLKAEKQMEICRKKNFLTLASEHACINNW
jgi:hypothetical protein